MEAMKPPRRVQVDAAAAEDPLALLISAFKAGRLVALLRGEGLTRSTVQELLRPESAAKLRAILTERVLSGREDRNPDPESQPCRSQPGYGKVLVFNAKETLRP
jgi:hypothetical protein